MRLTRRSDPPARTQRPRRWALAFALAAAALVAPAVARAAGDDPPASSPAGKLVLFDGKTLGGWEKTRFTHAGEVKVEDGAIVMKDGEPMTGITCTRKDLPTTNYELSYEAMRLTGVDFFAAATFPVGKSFITLVNGGWSGTVTGLSSLDGADASENQTGGFVEYRDKTWYRFRVRVSGKAIRAWINDKEVVTTNYEGRHVGTRIETRPNQPLGFATYETTGSVRKVEVRPLTAAEVAANDKVDD